MQETQALNNSTEDYSRQLLDHGSRWQKNGMDRVYFNDLPRWYGLNLDLYNTGNIATATLNGERISNSQAKKIEGRLLSAKVWYDVATGKFEGQRIEPADMVAIIKAIKAAAGITGKVSYRIVG